MDSTIFSFKEKNWIILETDKRLDFVLNWLEFFQRLRFSAFRSSQIIQKASLYK